MNKFEKYAMEKLSQEGYRVTPCIWGVQAVDEDSDTVWGIDVYPDGGVRTWHRGIEPWCFAAYDDYPTRWDELWEVEEA